MDFNSILFIVNAALNIPLSATAIAGNTLVLVSIARTPSLISPSNVLLLSLACTDLCIGLLVQPLYIALKFAQFTGTEKNIGTLDLFRVQTYCAGFLCIASFCNVSLLSVDRFLALHLHLRYKELVTVKRTVILLGILWIACVICMSLKASLPISIARIIAALVASLILFGNVILYYKIYRIVRRHQLQINTQAPVQSNTASVNITNLKRSFINMFYVYILFMACCLPYIVIAALKSRVTPQLPMSIVEVSWTCVYTNSSLNPLIFSWRVQGIRAAVKSTTVKIKEWLFCIS